MQILLTDETNTQPTSDAKFFVYGGIMFSIESLSKLHTAIDNIRKKAGYRPHDELKFDTRSRPAHVTKENATEAKRNIVELCIKLDCKFIAHIILHDIIRNQDLDQQVQWAADYVIGRFNRYLTEIGDEGICIIDNLPTQSQFRYLSDKFASGLKLANGKTVLLDRIKLFSSTCINASHASSAMDIVLGSFRYCINNPKNPEAARGMMRNVAKLMWHKKVGETIHFGNRGLISRPKPKDIINSQYKGEYDQLYDHLKKLIRGDGDQSAG
jgi:hypothetical protein